MDSRLEREKPTDGVIELPACCLCRRKGGLLALNRQFGYQGQILQCRQCGFAWLTPQYEAPNLRTFYEQIYRRSKAEANDQRRILGDIIRSRSQMRFWKPYLDRKARILEIGAGYGTNARNILAAGYTNLVINEWDTSSLDPELASTATVDTRTIEVMEDGSFDFIILSHVLEHFSDLDSSTAQLARLLSPGGKIFIEVPNNLNLHVKGLIRESFHYYFFTPHSLAKLLSRHGFRTLECKTYGKKVLIGNLSQRQWQAYRLQAEADRDFDDIVALPHADKNAYWIRAIFQKHGTPDPAGG